MFLVSLQGDEVLTVIKMKAQWPAWQPLNVVEQSLITLFNSCRLASCCWEDGEKCDLMFVTGAMWSSCSSSPGDLDTT
ncbi:spondin-1-like [Tachysurus ichikawai]